MLTLIFFLDLTASATDSMRKSTAWTWQIVIFFGILVIDEQF